MARTSTERVLVTGTLVLRSPLHVGTAEAAFATDMPVARDGLERLYIAGSTLAGVCRDDLCRFHGWREGDPARDAPDAFRALFGYQRGDQGHASRLLFDDAVALEGTTTELRDHVRIDRRHGVADDTGKFDEEIIAAGGRFAFRLEAEIGGDEGEVEQHKTWIARCVRRLTDGAIRIGANTASGYGRVVLEGARVCCFPLTTPAGLFAWLGDAESADEFLVDSASWLDDRQDARAFVEVALALAMDGPLMVKSGEEGEEVDMVPARTRGDTYVLPGSGLKGVLRTRMERIWATLVKRLPPSRGLPDKALSGLLGHHESYDNTDRRARARVRSRLEVDEVELGPATGAGAVRIKTMHHVRIDRFTGGAFEQALFQVAPIWDESRRFVLRVSVREPEAWELGLLGMAVRDLLLGDLRIGFGTRRGLGRLRGVGVEGWIVRGMTAWPDGVPTERSEALGSAFWSGEWAPLRHHLETWAAALTAVVAEEAA